jgi:hypothetical protein
MTLVDLAIRHSRLSDAVQKHGSVLVLGTSQTFMGYNHYCGGVSLGYATIHSEAHAIKNFLTWCRMRRVSDVEIRRKLKHASIITVRVCRKGIVKYAPPCSECAKILDKYEIKRVIYSDESGNMTKRKSTNLSDALPSSATRYFDRMRNSCCVWIFQDLEKFIVVKIFTESSKYFRRQYFLQSLLNILSPTVF